MTDTPTLPDSTAVVGVPDELAERLAQAMDALLTGMEVSGGWQGDDDLYQEGHRALQAFWSRDDKALASRSTQPEGEAGSKPDWKIVDEYGQAERAVQNAGTSSRAIFDQALDLRDRAREALLARMANLSAPKPIPQPKAAASGDVVEVERVVDAALEARGNAAYWKALRAEDTDELYQGADNTRETLLTAIRSLAAQARAQALEEAAKVAEKEASRLAAFEADRGFSPRTATSHLQKYQCECVADAIRALISQPSVPAGEPESNGENVFRDMVAIAGGNASVAAKIMQRFSDFADDGLGKSRVTKAIRQYEEDDRFEREGKKIEREAGSTQGGEAR